MKKNILLTLLGLILLNGCTTVDMYHGPSSDEPHAFLRFQPLEGSSHFLGTTAIRLVSVNRQNFPQYKLPRKVTISPGINDIVVTGVSSDLTTKATVDLVLNVKHGETYTVKRKAEKDDMLFFVVDSKGKVVAEQSGEKQAMGTKNSYFFLFQNKHMSFFYMYMPGRSKPQYHDVKKTAPHATLKFEKFLFGNAISVYEINGHELSRWQMSQNTFLVPPGETSILMLVQCAWDYSDLAKIYLEAGHKYYFSREVGQNTVTFTVTKDSQDVVYRNTVLMSDRDDPSRYY